MSVNLMLDNWTLQEITKIMESGLSDEGTGRLKINYQNGCHKFVEIPLAAVQIEALLNLLTDIVTRERLIVDEQFSPAWENELSPLISLKEKGILDIYKFNYSPDFRTVRQSALMDICATESLRIIQKANEDMWKDQKKSADPYMSQLVWGTAGNLARSYILSTPYSPYPLRRDVLEQTTFRPSRPDAIQETLTFVNQERVKLYQESRPGVNFRSAQIILPPIAVEIIESSQDIDDLFEVAFQMREKYLGFRECLKKYQKAIDEEAAIDIRKYKEIFNSVSKFCEPGLDHYGNFSISLGVAFLNFNVPLPGVEWVKSKFGIRATLQKLVLEKKGQSSLDKLLNMFDETSKAKIFNIQSYFQIS